MKKTIKNQTYPLVIYIIWMLFFCLLSLLVWRLFLGPLEIWKSIPFSYYIPQIFIEVCTLVAGCLLIKQYLQKQAQVIGFSFPRFWIALFPLTCVSLFAYHHFMAIVNPVLDLINLDIVSEWILFTFINMLFCSIIQAFIFLLLWKTSINQTKDWRRLLTKKNILIPGVLAVFPALSFAVLNLLTRVYDWSEISIQMMMPTTPSPFSQFFWDFAIAKPLDYQEALFWAEGITYVIAFYFIPIAFGMYVLSRDLKDRSILNKLEADEY